MRPDEEASEAYIARDKKFRQNIKTGIGAAASIAGTAGLGGLASKVMPFLNQYVPMGLAMQGINKVAPKLGEFLRRGQSMGLDVKDGMAFIKSKLDPEGNDQAVKEDKNVIQKYSPELHQFIDEQLKRGRSSLEAGAIAQNDKRFSDTIKKITKDHKAPWSSILQAVYGEKQNQGATESAAPQQPGQQPQQGGQPGPGQQDLMDILQKIQQARGGQGQ